MRKQIKAVLSLAAAFLMLCVIQLHTVSAASPSLFVSADATVLSEGGYVDVNVNMNNNPSVSTLGVALNYDNSILQYDSVTWSSSFSESDMKLASDTGSEINLSVVCKDCYTEDGVIATVRFQALQNAKEIPISLTLRDMTNADMSVISDSQVSQDMQTADDLSEQTNNGLIDGGSQEEDDWADDWTEESDPDGPQPSRADGGDADSAGQTIESSTIQQFTEENVRSAPDLRRNEAETDQNYKTGAGIGRDIFLILAVVCGSGALVLAAVRSVHKK